MSTEPGRARIDELPGSGTAERFEGRTAGSSVSVFLSHNTPGTGPPLHKHPYEETFFVIEGDVLFTVDGTELEAGDGDIVVVPANAPHKFVSRGETHNQFSIHPVAQMETTWLEE
jgi:quercetin dioxygenase-like cupin family protein